MVEIQHFSHECALTSPEIKAYGVCNICDKDELVELACKPCNFNLCEACSKLPQKVSHDFHPDHPLELSLRQYDRKPTYIICSGCGNMSSRSFYECKECENIYLDLSCALLKNIVTSWDAKEMLHYSHCHMLRRSRPGLNAKGLCLLCELHLSPSVICYGCVHCYLFVHERCFDLPRDIQHPVHPAHPLRRLDYTHNSGGGRDCDACGIKIYAAPFNCLECDFNLHLRCADSLLRGLMMHKSHKHRLFYVNNSASRDFGKGSSPCQICMKRDVISVDSYYKCVECGLNFHFECLKIPEYVVKKSCHFHPLVCQVFVAEHDYLEYCGVCETRVHAQHHVYSCQECDFLGHIECILREEEPSPLYLKDLYSCAEDITRPTYLQDSDSNKLEDKLMVKDIKHTHVMKPLDMSELDEGAYCKICQETILGSPFKCETCSFWTHSFCAELGKPTIHRLHLNHPLTLLPDPPTRVINLLMNCDNCKSQLYGFNLFCRICDFIIDVKCALKGKDIRWVLGQEVFGAWRGRCIGDYHSVVEVIISSAESLHCVICDESLYGKALSCMECKEIYHPWCVEVGRKKLYGHPLHYDHMLRIFETSGNTCNACKSNITKYGYCCSDCELNFHVKCIQVASVSTKIKSHRHNLYNFWIDDDSQFTRACGVCNRPCGPSFYGCIVCKFCAHVECLGFPDNVNNQQHQHSVSNTYIYQQGSCSLCGLHRCNWMYTCNHCKDVFHMECIMSQVLILSSCTTQKPKTNFSFQQDDRKPATEEEQRQDIYLTYLEHDLLKLLR